MTTTRFDAWKDSLPRDRLDRVERIEGMPVEMAIAFLYDDLSTRIDAVNKPLWRQALGPMAVVGAFVAGLAGLNPRGWQ